MLAVSHDTEFEVTSHAGATGHAPNHVVSLIKIQELRRSHAVLAAPKNKARDKGRFLTRLKFKQGEKNLYIL